MRPYQALRYYSPAHDCDCTRLSIFDGKGGEFFQTVPMTMGQGKAWREERERRLEQIEQAIDLGLQPGEVVVDQEAVSVAG